MARVYVVYQEAITRAPDNAFFYKDSADVLLKLQRYEDALAAYNEAIVRNPTIGSWYSYRAEAKKLIREKT